MRFAVSYVAIAIEVTLVAAKGPLPTARAAMGQGLPMVTSVTHDSRSGVACCRTAAQSWIVTKSAAGAMIRALGLLAALAAAMTAWTPPPAVGEPPPGNRCGVDLGAPAIATAVRSLRPAFTDRDVAWDPVPYAGNFDPCATLSTALVTVEGATGSSPDHALFFHYGDYLGTATWQPYPFTTLNTEFTTDDAIVLQYKDGRNVCTACHGPVSTVRYQWQHDHVQMLNPPPPGP
jgi:LppP/LprE lipoprotein